MSYPLTEEELKKIENHKIKVECVKALSYYEYGKKSHLLECHQIISKYAILHAAFSHDDS
jgi:hypothetical protein